uniref:GINS complex subunit 4 n=1 Tax=Parastrongyloides trichosuri TaxID=131310 RepID=A0A0N4ZK42_PARTI
MSDNFDENETVLEGNGDGDITYEEDNYDQNGIVSEGEESDEEAQQMTCTEIMGEMLKIWNNQNLAPDLLMHRYEIVDALLEMVKQEKEKVLDMDIEYGKKPKPVTYAIRKMEISRIEYMVKSYINKRLQLIEEHPLHYLNIDTKLRNEGKEELLDYRERNHCKKYVEIYDELMVDNILSRLEGIFAAKPVAAKHPVYPRVIAKVVDESLRQLEIPDYNSPGTTSFHDVELHNIYAIPWIAVKDHVDSGRVDLM